MIPPQEIRDVLDQYIMGRTLHRHPSWRLQPIRRIFLRRREILIGRGRSCSWGLRAAADLSSWTWPGF